MNDTLASLTLCGAIGLVSACTGTETPEGLEESTLELELRLSAVKQLELSWDALPAASSYQVFVQRGVNGIPEALGPELEGQSLELELALHQQSGLAYFVRACGGAQCIDSAARSLSGDLSEAVGYLKAASPDSGANFGASVSLSADGSVLAVGAPEHADHGAVFLFGRDGSGAWVEQDRVEADNAGSGDLFGTSVALDPSGAYLLVGAPEEDGGENGTTAKSDSGAAYLFALDELDPETGLASWSQQAYLKAPNYDFTNLKLGDLFGSAVALDTGAMTLAIGAPKEGQQGGSGAVYMFHVDETGTTWSHARTLKGDSNDEGDQFGASIALSTEGNRLAVGVPFEDSGQGGPGADPSDDEAADSGAVFVFSRMGEDPDALPWSSDPHYLKPSSPTPGASFGQVALDASGTVLAVGAPNPEAIGSAYLFARDPELGWREQVQLADPGPDGERDQFGAAVALSGDGTTLVVGVAEDDSAARGVGGDESNIEAFRSGAARVFTGSGTQWAASAYVKASNSGNQDQFGRAVALDETGEVLAVGALEEDGSGADLEDDKRSNSGAAYLF